MSDSAGTATGLGSADGPGRGSGDGSGRSARVRGDRGPGRIRRTVGGVMTYYRQVVAELRKVIWPTRRDLITYTMVVVIFVAFMVAVVSVYDFAFSQAVLKVFGDG